MEWPDENYNTTIIILLTNAKTILSTYRDLETLKMADEFGKKQFYGN